MEISYLTISNNTELTGGINLVDSFGLKDLKKIEFYTFVNNTSFPNDSFKFGNSALTMNVVSHVNVSDIYMARNDWGGDTVAIDIQDIE